MKYQKIQLECEGPIAILTLNRPEKLNALNPEMLLELEQAVSELERDTDVRAVLLTGAGDRAFCVGADINAWAALEPLDMWRQWIHLGHRVFNRLAALRQPVLAVLNGYTFGGGLELALAADIRFAAGTASLALPEVKIATTPGWGGTLRLPALIGPARAKQMIFSGARIDAKKAERWGLVNEVFPQDTLLQEALTYAHEIAQNAPISVQVAKQLVDENQRSASGAAVEALAGALTATTQDGQEGVAAFNERRAARFTGK